MAGSCASTQAALVNRTTDSCPSLLNTTSGAGGFGRMYRRVKVVYSEQQGRRVFWAPLVRLGRPDWDAGWLLTYILAYVPAMLLLRCALRLA